MTMNLATRAALRTVRAWKTTLLLFGLLLAAATLALAGLAVADAQDEQAAELRGSTGASFTLAGYNDWTVHAVPQETIDKIAAMDGVSAYNASTWTIGNLVRADGTQLTVPEPLWEGVATDFYTTGCYNSEYAALFLSGEFRLVEGHHLTGEGHEVLIGKRAAEQNGVRVGDTVSFKNGNDGDPAVECTVAGIFEVVADNGDDQPTMARPSTLYNSENYAFVSMDAMTEALAPYAVEEPEVNSVESVDFFVADAADLDRIVEEVRADPSIDWDNYYLTVNDEVYQRVAGSLSDVGTLVGALVALVVAVSAAVVTLVLCLAARGRRREVGVLLSLGFGKPAIVLQQVLEALLVAAVAFPAAYLAAGWLAGVLGGLLGQGATAGVVVGPGHFALVGGVGLVLLVVAVLASCASVVRLRPRDVLTRAG